jgi:hypothetical protein
MSVQNRTPGCSVFHFKDKFAACCPFEGEENTGKTVFATDMNHSLFCKQRVTGCQSSSLCCTVISKQEESHETRANLIKPSLLCLQLQPFSSNQDMEQVIFYSSIKIVSAFLHTLSNNNIDSFELKVQAWMKIILVHYDFKYSTSV